MSKQEEIREKVRTTLVYAYLERITPEDMGAVPEDFEWADEVIKDLSALGVVLLKDPAMKDCRECDFVLPLILPEPAPPVTAFIDSCPVCGGLGFIEFGHGIYRQQCEACLGTGLSESKISKEEFELSYATKSNITVERLRELGLAAVPCDCGEEGCQGWAMNHQDEVTNVSNSGAGESTKDSGSGDTGKPKRTRESKSTAKLTKKPE